MTENLETSDESSNTTVSVERVFHFTGGGVPSVALSMEIERQVVEFLSTQAPTSVWHVTLEETSSH